MEEWENLEDAYRSHKYKATVYSGHEVKHKLSLAQFTELWGDKWPPENTMKAYYIGRIDAGKDFTAENCVLKRESKTNPTKEPYLKWIPAVFSFIWINVNESLEARAAEEKENQLKEDEEFEDEDEE